MCILGNILVLPVMRIDFLNTTKNPNTMKTTTIYATETIDVLNDLVLINNDRIEGYRKAQSETKEEDLKMLFNKMMSESMQLKQALTNQIKELGGEPDMSATTTSGKIYRVWMDIKAVFTGKDRHAVLSNCEFGEDAAQNAYKSALESDDLTTEVRNLIREQQKSLKISHDEIKALRDQAK